MIYMSLWWIATVDYLINTAKRISNRKRVKHRLVINQFKTLKQWRYEMVLEINARVSGTAYV